MADAACHSRLALRRRRLLFRALRTVHVEGVVDRVGTNSENGEIARLNASGK